MFAVNRCECFIESENIITTFSGCKLSKKQHWASSKFSCCYKKHGGPGLTSRYTEYQK